MNDNELNLNTEVVVLAYLILTLRDFSCTDFLDWIVPKATTTKEMAVS